MPVRSVVLGGGSGRMGYDIAVHSIQEVEIETLFMLG